MTARTRHIRRGGGTEAQRTAASIDVPELLRKSFDGPVQNVSITYSWENSFTDNPTIMRFAARAASYEKLYALVEYTGFDYGSGTVSGSMVFAFNVRESGTSTGQYEIESYSIATEEDAPLSITPAGSEEPVDVGITIPEAPAEGTVDSNAVESNEVSISVFEPAVGSESTVTIGNEDVKLDEVFDDGVVIEKSYSDMPADASAMTLVTNTLCKIFKDNLNPETAGKILIPSDENPAGYIVYEESSEQYGPELIPVLFEITSPIDTEIDDIHITTKGTMRLEFSNDSINMMTKAVLKDFSASFSSIPGVIDEPVTVKPVNGEISIDYSFNGMIPKFDINMDFTIGGHSYTSEDYGPINSIIQCTYTITYGEYSFANGNFSFGDGFSQNVSGNCKENSDSYTLDGKIETAMPIEDSRTFTAEITKNPNEDGFREIISFSMDGQEINDLYWLNLCSKLGQ